MLASRRTPFSAAASFEARKAFTLGGKQLASGDPIPPGAADSRLLRMLYEDWTIDVKGSPTAPGTVRGEATATPAQVKQTKVPEKRRTA